MPVLKILLGTLLSTISPQTIAITTTALTTSTTLLAGFSQLACAPEPIYDDNIDVQAVAVAEGSLAGTFANIVVNADLIDAPLIGPQIGGGLNYMLVNRVYDAEAKLYRQTSKVCNGANFEVGGVTTDFPPQMYEKVPPSLEETVEVDHDLGIYTMTGALQLLGLRDLPDPYTSPIPTNGDEAKLPEHAAHVYDMDEDGLLAVTMKISGLVSGETRVVQRRKNTLSGVLLSSDRILGLNEHQKEGFILETNNPLISSDQGGRQKHPDPKESWFHEIRLDDGADCVAVIDATTNGSLPRLRPF